MTFNEEHTELHAAMYDNNTKQVQSLLSAIQSADEAFDIASAQGFEGRNLLHISLRNHQNLEILRLVLEKLSSLSAQQWNTILSQSTLIDGFSPLEELLFWDEDPSNAIAHLIQACSGIEGMLARLVTHQNKNKFNKNFFHLLQDLDSEANTQANKVLTKNAAHFAESAIKSALSAENDMRDSIMKVAPDFAKSFTQAVSEADKSGAKAPAPPPAPADVGAKVDESLDKICPADSAQLNAFCPQQRDEVSESPPVSMSRDGRIPTDQVKKETKEEPKTAPPPAADSHPPVEEKIKLPTQERGKPGAQLQPEPKTAPPPAAEAPVTLPFEGPLLQGSNVFEIQRNRSFWLKPFRTPIDLKNVPVSSFIAPTFIDSEIRSNAYKVLKKVYRPFAGSDWLEVPSGLSAKGNIRYVSVVQSIKDAEFITKDHVAALSNAHGDFDLLFRKTAPLGRSCEQFHTRLMSELDKNIVAPKDHNNLPKSATPVIAAADILMPYFVSADNALMFGGILDGASFASQVLTDGVPLLSSLLAFMPSAVRGLAKILNVKESYAYIGLQFIGNKFNPVKTISSAGAASMLSVAQDALCKVVECSRVVDTAFSEVTASSMVLTGWAAIPAGFFSIWALPGWALVGAGIYVGAMPLINLYNEHSPQDQVWLDGPVKFWDANIKVILGNTQLSAANKITRIDKVLKSNADAIKQWPADMREEFTSYVAEVKEPLSKKANIDALTDKSSFDNLYSAWEGVQQDFWSDQAVSHARSIASSCLAAARTIYADKNAYSTPADRVRAKTLAQDVDKIQKMGPRLINDSDKSVLNELISNPTHEQLKSCLDNEGNFVLPPLAVAKAGIWHPAVIAAFKASTNQYQFESLLALAKLNFPVSSLVTKLPQPELCLDTKSCCSLKKEGAGPIAGMLSPCAENNTCCTATKADNFLQQYKLTAANCAAKQDSTCTPLNGIIQNWEKLVNGSLNRYSFIPAIELLSKIFNEVVADQNLSAGRREALVNTIDNTIQPWYVEKCGEYRLSTSACLSTIASQVDKTDKLLLPHAFALAIQQHEPRFCGSAEQSCKDSNSPNSEVLSLVRSVPEWALRSAFNTYVDETAKSHHNFYTAVYRGSWGDFGWWNLHPFSDWTHISNKARTELQSDVRISGTFSAIKNELHVETSAKYALLTKDDRIEIDKLILSNLNKAWAPFVQKTDPNFCVLDMQDECTKTTDNGSQDNVHKVLGAINTQSCFWSVRDEYNNENSNGHHDLCAAMDLAGCVSEGAMKLAGCPAEKMVN